VNLSSHLMQRMLRLDPPLTRDLVIERDLRVPMPDGAVLLADRYLPRAGDQALPVALLRSPYGRRGLIAAGLARPLAERGFQVLTLPLGRADVVAIGHRSDYVQDILADDADDARWAGIDHRHRVAEVSVPVSSIGGWYDIFLPGQLRDFRILQEAGRPARLTVGPWTHISADGTPLRESIAATASGSRYPAAPSRATPATTAPANRAPPPPAF